jgi:hypothetical protein
MPKIEITSKFDKGDTVYLIYMNAIVRGTIHSANVYSVWGRDEDPRCIHQQQEDCWSEIGDEIPDVYQPTVEYYVELDHPIVDKLSPGKPVHERILGSARLFREPKALLAYLNRKFEKAYGQKISTDI